MKHLVIVKWNGEISLDTSCRCPTDANGNWTSAVFLKGDVWVDNASNVSTTTATINAHHVSEVAAVMFLTNLSETDAQRVLAGECVEF